MTQTCYRNELCTFQHWPAMFLFYDWCYVLFVFTYFYRFGGGYSLTIHINGESRVQSLKDYINNELMGAEIVEEHYTRLRYQLPLGSQTLPIVLSTVEAARRENLILDYSLSQTTLEDVSIILH